MAVYSVNDTSIKAVADEIRGKTGLTDALSLEQMAQDVAASPAIPRDIPDYVQTEAERVAAAVKALQNDNTLSFIAFSDTHIGNSSYDVSVTHAMQAAHIIQRLVPVDFTAHLGDHVTGAAADSLTTHLGNLMESLRVEAIASPALRLVGNHDANSYNAASYLSAEDTNGYIGRYARNVVKPSAEPERGYFYMDIAAKKTRVICLNTGDQKGIAQANTADGHFVSAAQLAWLASSLDMTGKDGWRIIVLSHHPIHWYGGMPNVLTILDAYVAGSSGSVTSGGTTVSYNFSGKNAAKLVATFHGHTHNLIHGLAGTAEIIRMGTPNGCYSRSNEYGSSSYGEDFRNKYGETTTYSKTASSAKDTAFCVYTIDFDKQTVFATCYGAGYDRVMSYAGVSYYKVTATMPASLSINNITSSIKQGDSYIAELIPKSGYSISSVKVTMGGTDVTSSVYSDGVISIEAVTGDIAIVATVTGYTTIIDTIGYTDGKRLSTSSGNLSTQDGYVTTGMIDLGGVSNNHVIRTKGVDFRTANKGYCAYVFYGDASGTFKSSGYLNASETASIGISFDDEGNLTFVLKPQIGARYLKICGYGSGANLIVTINEEISDSSPENPDEPDTPVSYTNLVPTSKNADGTAYNSGLGYKEGYRISSSSGNESALAGAVVTGFIPYSGQVVRVYGSPEEGSYTGQYLALYDSSHARVNVYAANWTGVGVKQVDGKYQFTFDPAAMSNAQTYFDRAAYIRVSAANCKGSDLIVTFNEEIK